MKYYKHVYKEYLLKYCAQLLGAVSKKDSKKMMRKLSIKSVDWLLNRIIERTEYISGYDPRLGAAYRRFLEIIDIVNELESAHSRSGCNHIVIPDEDTLRIIMSTDVSKVSYKAVRTPYPAFGISFPNSWSYHESCLLAGITSTEEGPLFTTTMGYYGFMKAKAMTTPAVSVMREELMNRLMASREDNIKEIKENLSEIAKTKILEGLPVASDSDIQHITEQKYEGDVINKLVIQLCVFIQAYPGVLKQGPGVGVVITARSKNRSLKRKRKPRNTQPSHIFTLPEELKKSQRVSWCPLHFRELRHPRYRRVDDEGNLLEVGEPGNTRIVEVKGHMRGGNVEHVDKDTKLAEALESR
jgi:hypothetical protein